MIIQRLLIILFLQIIVLNFSEGTYERPSHIKKTVWNVVTPHLLPENHPIKKKLDKIFSKDRVVLNKNSMKKAGFTTATPQKVTRLIVTKHPQLEGYVIKTYLDAQKAHKNKSEEHFWLMRIKGANAIRDLISDKEWEANFKVPKKWIYPLPKNPSPPSSFQRINFILVEEDMNILGNKENKRNWGSDVITQNLLKDLITILDTLGLKDCAKPDNIPFSHDGKIAFVDTQTHHEWPVNYKKLTEYLSPSMKNYWKQGIKK